MDHFLNMTGSMNGDYIAWASEWRQIYFYTYEVVFVYALMNNSSDDSDRRPHSFSGETNGGRVT